MSGSRKKLLVVEDDPGLQRQLRWSFDDFAVSVANDRDSAITQLRRFEPPVVTLDLGLPPDPGGASEGFATLEKIIALAPDTKVIVITGQEDHQHALDSIAIGASDFFEKPIEPELLRFAVERAFRLYELERENRRLQQFGGGSPLQGIIAGSPQMLRVCQTVEKVAPADVTTLLLGESGTGKELIARALHRLSMRGAKRFVAINCAAIPEPLLESELFGYERGAFTGAAKQTLGKIECAEGGTLFLDEVGDLPLPLQAKLLRFCQERTIERLGGREEIAVDVRIVCATHQNLQKLIAQGCFREDLYYRISELTIRIPSLAERDGDAVLIARAFLDEFSKALGRPKRGFTAEALFAIQHHSWPGNVREMENRLKRAVIMAEGKHIAASDLELTAPEQEAEPMNLREVREHAERHALARAFSLTDRNISRASELLGITRPTLYSLMNKYGIKFRGPATVRQALDIFHRRSDVQ